MLIGRERPGEGGEGTGGGHLVAAGGPEGNREEDRVMKGTGRLRIMEEKGGGVWRCGGGEVGMTGRRQGERHIQGGISQAERGQ